MDLEDRLDEARHIGQAARSVGRQAELGMEPGIAPAQLARAPLPPLPPVLVYQDTLAARPYVWQARRSDLSSGPAKADAAARRAAPKIGAHQSGAYHQPGTRQSDDLHTGMLGMDTAFIMNAEPALVMGEEQGPASSVARGLRAPLIVGPSTVTRAEQVTVIDRLPGAPRKPPSRAPRWWESPRAWVAGGVGLALLLGVAAWLLWFYLAAPGYVIH